MDQILPASLALPLDFKDGNVYGKGCDRNIEPGFGKGCEATLADPCTCALAYRDLCMPGKGVLALLPDSSLLQIFSMF